MSTSLTTLKQYWKKVNDAIGTIGSAVPTEGMQVSGKDEDNNSQIIKVDDAGNQFTQLKGSNVTNDILSAVTYAQKGPIYLGIKKFGTLTYNAVEQPMPLRPWRSGTDYKYPAVIDNDAGESTGVSFDGNTISITGDLFTANVGIGFILREDDEIEVDTTSGTNDGTYTVDSMTTEAIVVKGASPQFTTETAGDAGTTTIYAFGDILEQAPSDCDIADTSSTAENVLRWHHFVDSVHGELKHIYICDRPILSNISWNALNTEGWILGTSKTIDGVEYTLRSLTGGAANRDGEGGSADYGGGILPNEWNRYILNGVDSEGPFFDNAPIPADGDYLVSSSLTGDNAIRRGDHNQAWHWLEQYSWCQETAWHEAARRADRGNISARYWHHNAASSSNTHIGFRPALVKN